MIQLTDSGAGTGKSYTMRKRIEEISKSTQAKILGVTFTNLARDNMLRDLGNINNVEISTIYHLTCKFVSAQSEYNLEKDLTFDIKLNSLKKQHKANKLCTQQSCDNHKSKYFLNNVDNLVFNTYIDFVESYLKYLEMEISELESKEEFAGNLVVYYFFEKWKMKQQFVNLTDTLYVYHFEDNTKWDLILIDECQDTNPTEFHALFRRNLCKDYMLFADSKQTLYKWRGANFKYIKDYVMKFSDYEEIHLTHNYRSSEKIVNIANKLSGREDSVENKNLASLVEVKKHEAWGPLMQNLFQLVKTSVSKGSVGILTKTNKEALSVYEYFKGNGLTIGKKIKNVKDVSYNIMGAIDLYKLHHEPFKSNYLFDILLNNLVLESKKSVTTNQEDYLILAQSKLATSVVRAKSLNPYDVIRPTEFSVVFDFETNGLDVEECEIVQIGAIKLDSNLNEVSRFDKVLRIKGIVGESSKVHGFTDEFIKSNSYNYEETLDEFLEYIKGCNCYAHNCSFDSEVLRSHYFKRTGNRDIETDLDLTFYCTLDLAKFVYPKEKMYKLGYLNEALNLGCEPNHNAIFDVECTVCLLKDILNKLPEKLRSVKKYVKEHETFANCLEKARRVYNTSRNFNYRQFSNCYSVFAKLGCKFVNDSNEKTDSVLLKYFVDNIKAEEDKGKSYCEIINDIDSYNSKDTIEGDYDIWVMTTHQSKGLEFDTVIGVCSMDWWGNEDDVKCLEYVMFTRAKKDFYLMSCKSYNKLTKTYEFPFSLIDEAISEE